MTETIGKVFWDRVERFGHVQALFAPHRIPPVSLTYRELGEKVRLLGAGLLALGVQKGDRIGLFSDNCPEWITSDLAVLSIGAISVPRGSDTSIAEIWYIVNHSEARGIFLENRRLFDRLAHEISSAPSLEFIVMLDDSAAAIRQRSSLEIFSLSEVCDLGEKNLDAFDTATSRVSAEDIAAIVYTSGTTGIPKGVPLQHQNLLYQCETIDLGFEIRPGDVLLSILPAWHVYERIAEYFGMYHGATIYYTDKRWLRDDMAKANPAFIPCVPRIWESVYDAIMAKLAKESAFKQKLVCVLLDLSRRFVRHRRVVAGHFASKIAPTPRDRLLSLLKACVLWGGHLVADWLVYRKIRALTGQRLKAAVSGGGSLASYLDDFFEAVGIPILNGYGLTETSPVLAVRTVNENIRGTVGKPLRGTLIEIRDDEGNKLPQGEVGVIWAKGPQVMSGYYRNDEETRRVLTPDGWFNTGDLGWFTWQGHLVICGRAKDTIVLSSGENVEPEPIETAARKSPFIQQIVVVGQDKKALGALVVPDFQNLAAHLGLPPDTPHSVIITHPSAERVVRESINGILKEDGSFRPFELIHRVVLMEEPFTPENGLLTHTLKPKRNVIAARFSRLIETMFE
ncbi:MAG: long-chain fatty acid--CoA ligase [Candidatus Sumerlaeaceae bacterium]|nr:long-chain fatty acid--CoA ligase [Candidatus Sumerlaeaceae bacterium]